MGGSVRCRLYATVSAHQLRRAAASAARLKGGGAQGRAHPSVPRGGGNVQRRHVAAGPHRDQSAAGEAREVLDDGGMTIDRRKVQACGSAFFGLEEERLATHLGQELYNRKVPVLRCCMQTSAAIRRGFEEECLTARLGQVLNDLKVPILRC